MHDLLWNSMNVYYCSLMEFYEWFIMKFYEWCTMTPKYVRLIFFECLLCFLSAIKCVCSFRRKLMCAQCRSPMLGVCLYHATNIIRFISEGNMKQWILSTPCHPTLKTTLSCMAVRELCGVGNVPHHVRPCFSVDESYNMHWKRFWWSFCTLSFCIVLWTDL